MKQLTWYIVGLVGVTLFGGLAVFATLESASLISHLPSDSWLGIATYRFAIWVLYAGVCLILGLIFARRVRFILRSEGQRVALIKPSAPLWAATWVTFGATLMLAGVTGYGTRLGQATVLNSWGLVATITSATFADHHDVPVMALASLLNVVLFFIPAGSAFLVIGRRYPRVFAAAIFAWTLFYGASLYFLFPATDGP